MSIFQIDNVGEKMGASTAQRKICIIQQEEFPRLGAERYWDDDNNGSHLGSTLHRLPHLPHKSLMR